ncbi:MAG: T9SS type A sorting domain-containing protein [Bacteroidota bacterium]
MKKLLLFTGASLLIGSMFAQQTAVRPVKTESANSFKAARFNTAAAERNTNAITSGYIDYSYQNVNDQSYVFGFNSTFVSADSSMNYVGVALFPFQGIFDYADNNVDFNFGYPSTYTYTIDSIFASLTHENNSGSANYLTMQLVQASNTGVLSTSSTVKWQDTIETTTTLSSGGNWLGAGASYLAEYAPGYTTTAGAKMGIVFKYYAPKMDSLGILGSSIDDGSGGTVTQSPYPTSYMANPPFIPTPAACRNIGYGNPVGSTGWFQAQDWEIWAKVTFNDITGISDNVMNKTATLYQNVPNPANGSTVIKYDLAKSSAVTISFYDLTGKKIKEIVEGEKAVGNYKTTVNISDLSKGVYFYTLRTSNGVELTKKMVITE